MNSRIAFPVKHLALEQPAGRKNVRVVRAREAQTTSPTWRQLVQLQRNGLGVNCRHAGGQHEALVTLGRCSSGPGRAVALKATASLLDRRSFCIKARASGCIFERFETRPICRLPSLNFLCATTTCAIFPLRPPVSQSEHLPTRATTCVNERQRPSPKPPKQRYHLRYQTLLLACPWDRNDIGQKRQRPSEEDLCFQLVRPLVRWLPDLGSNQGPTD